MKTHVRIKEQPAVGTSIYCEIHINDTYDENVIWLYGMYFVCNLDKLIIQYPDWLKQPNQQRIRKQIIDLGYKFKS